MTKDEIIGRTESVCPVCLKKIDAKKVLYEDGIYLEKNCEEHGKFKVLIWGNSDLKAYKSWDSYNSYSEIDTCHTEVDRGCPYDCGICSNHRQQTCCVLLEITKRCNLNCPICFASSGGDCEKDIPIKEIKEYYDLLLDSGGPFNIQLSGGEPTMRDDLEDIIKLGKDKGFTFFQLNTNGIRIAKDYDYLKRLEKAGLNCVFLQFDGISEKPYIKLRGRDLLELKLNAIENCKKAGVGVVLVPTVCEDVNLKEIGGILEFALKNMPTVRGVHFQPISFFGRYDKEVIEKRITIPNILEEIELQTKGKMKVDNFLAGGAENSYCSFHGNFLLMDDNTIKPLGASQNSCCSKKASSKQSREAVAKQWSGVKIKSVSCCESEPKSSTKSLDDFLNKFSTSTLAVSGMLFQDAWNLDIDRLKQCYIHVVSPDKKLIPFCAYNLTNEKGESLYRR